MSLHSYLYDWIKCISGVINSCEGITSLMFKCHMAVFVLLFLAAITGKKTGIRRWYILFLERMFKFAATKMREKSGDVRDANSPEEENLDESLPQEQDERLKISPDTPVAPKFFTDRDTFSLADPMPYLTAGIMAISHDPFVTRFDPEDLDSWNMLSRTKRSRVQAKSVTSLWVLGFLFRYTYLVPVRIVIFLVSFSTLIFCTFAVGFLPTGSVKRKINAFVITWCFDFVANAISVFARFHDIHNRPKHGVAVANHTSPIDTMLLATDNCYDVVGQKSKGVLGMFMSALSRSSTHIWFERSNSKDRSVVTKRLQAHTSDENLPPILVFPEGTCVNNTAVMIFRKGVFELDTVVHPIAIRFDARYGDAFWWQDGFFQHILCMMSSWAIVCDIWYLPPMKRRETESPAMFANRVRSAIANRAGLNELEWDAYTRYLTGPVKEQKEQMWKKKQQMELAKIFPRHCFTQSEDTLQKMHSNAQTQAGVA